MNNKKYSFFLLIVLFFVFSCSDKKEDIVKDKKITFITNGKRSGVDITIKSDTVSTSFNGISTDVHGIANYTLKNNSDLYLKCSYPNTYIDIDKGYFVKNSMLLETDTININLYPLSEIDFEIKIKSRGNQPIENAKIFHPDINIKSTFKNNKYYCSINKEDLIKNNKTIDDSIFININANTYTSEIFKLIIKTDKYSETNISLKKGLSQLFVFKDSETNKPIKNSLIYINGTKYKSTNTSGQLNYNYKEENIGKSIEIQIDESQYLSLKETYVLDANPSVKTINLHPIYIDFKLLVENIVNPKSFVLLSNRNNRAEYIEANKVYRMYFPSIEKKYNIEILDSDGLYETNNIELYINKSNLGQTKKIEMIKKTELSFLVKDERDKLLDNVNIYIDEVKIGSTNEKGEFNNYFIKSSNKARNISFKKEGYYFKPEKNTFKPGHNIQKYNMESIIFGINPIDYKTNKPFLDLIIENDNIINIDKSSSSKTIFLQFKAFGEYKLNIMDKGGDYQDTEYTINIKSNNNNSNDDFFLYQITFIKFILKNSDGESISSVIINDKEKEIGSTNTKGKLRSKIKFSDKYNASFYKPYYFKIDSIFHIEPGENEIEVFLEKIPPLTITVKNSYDNIIIANIPFKIDGENIFTNNEGNIVFDVKEENTTFDVLYNDNDEIYYSLNEKIKYNSSLPNEILVLKPIPYINLKLFYSDNTTPFAQNAKIFVNDKNVGMSDANGLIQIKVDDYNKTFSIIASKDNYEDSNIEIKPIQPITSSSLSMINLTYSFYLNDIFGNPIPEVNVNYFDENNQTDEYGKVDIYPKRLGDNIKIKFSSISDIFKDTVLTKNINTNNGVENIILKTKPLKLEIIVKNKIGIPGKGKIQIKPPPNNNSEFNLDSEGKALVDVYKSGNYFISYNVQFGSEFVTNEPRKKYIDISDKKIKEVFTIKDAKISVKTDNSVPVNVKYLGGQPVFNKQISGDGKQELTLPTYGQYQFEFTPEGWTTSKKEIRIITKPRETFSFFIDKNYSKCIEYYNEEDFENAIKYCEKVTDVKDPSYCQAREKEFFIYRDNWSEFDKATKTMQKYLENMNRGYCENNISYYTLYIDAATQIDIDNYTFDQLQELWKPRSGEPSKIKESFEQFVIECPITGTQCDKKEIQVKVKMIGAMTDIMCKYKDEYENTFDPVESRNYENFNKYLYNAVEKYFKNVPQNDLIKYKDKRSSCLIK